MKKFTTFINESKMSDLEEEFATIMFTDVKGSSDLWKKHKDDMFDGLNVHEKRMNEITPKHNGMIVKTVGDSYMIAFEGDKSLLDAVKMAVEIQRDLEDNEISVGKDSIRLRIGICFGDLYKKDTKIQNKDLVDFFGNTVNTASRMESKVSEVEGIAFSFIDDIDYQDDILKYLEDNDVDVEVVEYKDECEKDDYKRSARLLTDLQRKMCKPLKELKGVDEVRTYKLKV